MATTSGFVLDCSITLAWYFSDETDAYADAVQVSLTQASAVVPALWPLELANSLVVGERRGRSTVAQATTWLALVQKLPIRVDEETVHRAWNEVISVARSFNLSVYDACYLELAIRLGLPLATLDARLKTAAVASGVKAYVVDPAARDTGKQSV